MIAHRLAPQVAPRRFLAMALLAVLLPLVDPSSASYALSVRTTVSARPVASFGALDHSIVYDNGTQLILAPSAGTGLVGLSSLSTSTIPFKRPRYTGWQFMSYDNGFVLGDIFGHHRQVPAPLAAGEEVYDAWPSPDGLFIAWQLVTPGMVGGVMLDTAASRIVVTDQSGGNGRILVQQSAGSSYGDIPIIYGWRSGTPPTLLVQNTYGVSTMFGLHKGLEEFDPAIGDMVGDFLPPLGQDTLPTGEVLGLSLSGHVIVYATKDTNLPSGEGPLPTTLFVMFTAGRRISAIDVASSHHDTALSHQPAPRAYVFSRQAFISPDDRRIAYTRLDVIYPDNQIIPYIRPIACVANLDGTSKIDLGFDEQVMGWTDAGTLVVRREHSRKNGLYLVNATTRAAKLVVKGENLRVDGIVP